ncbi:MAG: hypothetical protein RID09_30260 [Coleofasciculus sp. G1-WW12-02]|uniref:hypothetical protein n=1 Tax=unclassified Coleofasciculus TaxID=2692782 RepID=UPI0032FF804E
MKTISKITLIAFLWIIVINSGTLGVLDTELRLQILFLFGCAAYQNQNTRKVLKVIGLWILGFIPLAFLGRLLDYIKSLHINWQSCTGRLSILSGV